MRPETARCVRCHEAVIVVWSTGGDCLTLNAAPTFPPHEHTYTGNADGTGWHRSQPVNRAGDSEPGTVSPAHHEMHRLRCRPTHGG